LKSNSEFVENFQSICDNCCKCIETPNGDFAEIGIDDILVNIDKPTPSRRKGKGNQYKIKSYRY
jgi:hypothetical protein